MSSDPISRARTGKLHWELRLLGALADARRFEQITRGLAEPFRLSSIQYVVAFEALGFPLGAAVARLLGTGLVLMRKTRLQDLFPEFEIEQIEDYSGDAKAFRVLRSAITSGARTLIVDDYLETGGQLRAAINLVERRQATVVGATFICCAKRCELDMSTFEHYNIHHLGPILDTLVPVLPAAH
jgi:adenine phosphoribosyltransferase